MLNLSKSDIEAAKNLVAYGQPKAVGYRILVKPLDVTAEMVAAEKELYPTLAAAGAVTKTDEQALRESKGTNYAVVVDIGSVAFNGELLGGKNWVQVGDVIIVDRYCGLEMELPPGSGDMFRYANDESILGKMEAKNV